MRHDTTETLGMVGTGFAELLTREIQDSGRPLHLTRWGESYIPRALTGRCSAASAASLAGTNAQTMSE